MKKLNIYIIILIIVSFTTGCSKDVQNNISVTKKQSDHSNFEVTTDDGLKIAGEYYKPNLPIDMLPDVAILIHQFKSSRKQWDKSFIDSLVKNNYFVVTYDIRSHGESDKAKVQMSELLTKKDEASKDLDAVLKWISEQQGINKDRIGIIGTSIGGSLAIYGAAFKGVKSVVAISSGKNTFEAFTGYNDLLMSARPIPRIKNVMFISGSRDNNYLEEEKYIYDNYLMDPREIINYDSEKHGKDLIEEYPEIMSVSVNWLNKTIR